MEMGRVPLAVFFFFFFFFFLLFKEKLVCKCNFPLFLLLQLFFTQLDAFTVFFFPFHRMNCMWFFFPLNEIKIFVMFTVIAQPVNVRR